MATLIVGGAAVAALAVAFYVVYSMGAANQRAQTGVDNAKAAERVADATADAPHTLDELRAPGRKL